jgi:hypothetical protein
MPEKKDHAAINRRRNAAIAACDRIIEILAKSDRSCWSCDYLDRGHCLQWREDVPQDSLDLGCEKFQAHGGGPF